MRRQDHQEWSKACKAEEELLSKAGTYEVMDLPKNAHAVNGRWVFKIKKGPKWSPRWLQGKNHCQRIH
jgi:hypothetical protein